MFKFLNGYKTAIGVTILAIGHQLEKAGKLPAGLVDTIVNIAGIAFTAFGAAHKVDKLTAAIAAKPATDGGATGGLK